MTNTINLGEVITAMITPFHSNTKQTLDLEKTISLANQLIKNGTDTLLLTGSTGEAAQLSDKEKEDIISCVRHFTPSGTKIMVSTGDTNTQRVIKKTKKAFELGADAALIAVPEYIKPPQKALLIHFGTIAKAVSGRPIMIYNIPGRTCSEILPETVAQLAHQYPNIIGIKQSLGNMDKISDMRALCPPDFQIYSGDDSLTLPMLSLGAKGVISVASHLEGNLIKQMIQKFKAGQVEEAKKIHQFLYPLFKDLFVEANPLPIKEALFQKGIIESPICRTLGQLSEDSKKKLSATLEKVDSQKAQSNNLSLFCRAKNQPTSL